jgi:hypothetical protein
MHPTRQVKLVQAQADWLDGMRRQFALPDSGKAFRCCLNWAAQTDHRFSAAAAATAAATAGDQACTLELAATEAQWAWLDGRASASLLIQDCMQFAAAEGDSVIFQVVRCKTGTSAAPGAVATVATSATQCAGAQKALAAASAPPSISSVVPVAVHNLIISEAFKTRGYSQADADIAAELCAKASWHGVRRAQNCAVHRNRICCCRCRCRCCCRRRRCRRRCCYYYY